MSRLSTSLVISNPGTISWYAAAENSLDNFTIVFLRDELSVVVEHRLDIVTDLESYSAISEQLCPSDVVLLMNTYFALMVEIIEQQHGCVIDFAGDGILCVFGAPNEEPKHAERAVRCVSSGFS